MLFRPKSLVHRRRIPTVFPKTILIHVGHGKTGSSFLQSTLANSSAPLAAHGIAYPVMRGNVENTKAGGVSSGNLIPTPEAFLNLLKNGWPGDQETLLLSSEGFFYQMQRNGFLEALRKELPDAELKILLYIRDPLDHAVSTYHQNIKRGAGAGDFDASLKSYSRPKLVADFLTYLDAFDAQVTILNYSRHRADLTNSFEAWLDVPRDSLITPPISVVNRSLTNGEAAFLRPFNEVFGVKGAQFLADPLCDQLSHIQAERPPASPKALGQFLNVMQRSIARFELDRLIPEPERYHLETAAQAAELFASPEDDPVYELRQSQIELIARVIIARMQKGRNPHPKPKSSY